MNEFVVEDWEVIGERAPELDFSPMQVEVFKKSQPPTGLIADSFEEPITYASGPREHTSVQNTREAQKRKVEREREIAEQIIVTQAQLDKMTQEAYEKGRQEALVDAIEGNNERFEKIEKQFKAIITDLEGQNIAFNKDLENFALSLTLDISKKIIDQAVEINPEYVVQTIREALKLSGGAQIRKIRVSPQDMEFIEVLKIAQTIKEYDGTWVFEADETIKAGCVLEGSAGLIDFQLDKAWERIKNKVLAMPK